MSQTKEPIGQPGVPSPANAPEAPVEAAPAAIAASGARPEAQPEMSSPVVGIGASAGGLAAFEAFFSAMPSDHESGMAFVLVQHLAPDQRERAICIVLSGTGSDGTLGVRAVKGEGGMVMAQDPDSADYDGMPRSAIATGLVDYVLPPAAMPARLRRLCGPRLWKNAAPGLCSDPPGPRHAQKDLWFAAYSNRPRFLPVRGNHHRPPGGVAHGHPPDGAAGRLSPPDAAEPRGGGFAVLRPVDRRHQLLPRPGGLRSPTNTSDPGPVCGQARD